MKRPDTKHRMDGMCHDVSLSFDVWRTAVRYADICPVLTHSLMYATVDVDEFNFTLTKRGET
jgi:hypothetical protein